MKGFFAGKKTAGLAAILLGLSLMVNQGCGKKEEAPKAEAPRAEAPGLPEGHPAADKTAEDITKAQHAGIKTQKEVRLSEDVRKKWQDVKIEITDLAANRAAIVDFKVGSSVQLTDDGYRLKVETFVPDYAIANNAIVSRSNEPKNPAVLVELLKGNESVVRGWIFKDFPEFNSYASDRFKLTLVAPSLDAKKAPGQAKKR